MPVLLPPADRLNLWHASAYGRERYGVGQRYWWDNRERQRNGSIVLQWIDAGRIVIQTPETTTPCSAGDLLVFEHGSETSYGQPQPLDEPYHTRWIALNGAGVVEHTLELIRRHGHRFSLGQDHPLIDELEQLIIDADPQHPAEPTKFAASAHALMMRLFDVADQRLMDHSTPVEQAVEFMLRRPHQPMSLKELAVRFGVSREHLSRSFRQRVGEAPHEYLARAKRRRALLLLRQTRLPLSDVARQAGYANAHALARHVREATGVSPSAYREAPHATA